MYFYGFWLFLINLSEGDYELDIQKVYFAKSCASKMRLLP